MSDPRSDSELAAQSCAGDPAALDILLLRNHDRVAGVMARKIPGDLRRLIDADDVIQQAFTVAVRRIGDFHPRGPDSFFYWLVAIADNVLLELARAQRAAKRGGRRAPAELKAPAASVDSLLEALAVQEHTPSASVATGEARQAVLTGLEQLSPDYRDVLRMRFLEGLGVSEVASRLGRTERAVQMLCHRALRSLREVLGRSSQFFSR
jgi:RNA polymerase sigma-70 factor (ECF subfamily)